MTPPDFPELLQRVRQGDERSYAVLWRRFNAPVLRYLRVLAGSGDVEDVAATTWMDVVKGLDRFEGGEAEFKAWLFTIARHRLLDLRRYQSRRPRTVADDLALERVAVAADAQDLVVEVMATEAALALIATLPPDQAEIVVLRVVGGLDVAEVAAIVGKKPGTVRVMTHRALQRLAATIGPDLVEPATQRNERGPDGA